MEGEGTEGGVQAGESEASRLRVKGGYFIGSERSECFRIAQSAKPLLDQKSR